MSTRSVALAALSAAVAALAAGAGSSAPQSFAGANGRLVVETGTGLFVVEPRAGDATRIHVPGTTSRDRSPAWSPDGRRIAFLSYRKGDGEIYVADADG